jgi:hypothetical protein
MLQVFQADSNIRKDERLASGCADSGFPLRLSKSARARQSVAFADTGSDAHGNPCACTDTADHVHPDSGARSDADSNYDTDSNSDANSLRYADRVI